MLATQLILPTRASASPPCPAERPPFSLLRYDESYTFLQDPKCRTEFWDPIKYIPLGNLEGWYLSLGGELRLRYEFFHNEDAGSAPSNSKGNNMWALQRYLLNGDLHLGANLRFFVQLISGLENGRIGGPRPQIDRDIFDVLQAFMDVVLPIGEPDALTARLGRQQLRYGSGRLIDLREPPNLPRSFDAARLLLRADQWSVDGFWSKPVLNETGVLDDHSDPQRSLWGVYAVHPLAVIPDGHTDLYYLGYENRRAQFDQGSGYELRHTVGTRLWGRPWPWEYDIELISQFGKFGSGTIQAWGIASATHYNLPNLPLRPRLGLRADITSGDRNPRSANLQTFNPLFPTAAYYNLQDPSGPQNLIHVHPLLDLYFGNNVTATADWGFFWRKSLDDGVYRLSGSLLRTGQLSRARYVGSTPALTLTWKPTRHITVLASYVHFFAGPFFKETPPGKDVDYFTTWITYKF
jgi:Alginate export